VFLSVYLLLISFQILATAWEPLFALSIFLIFGKNYNNWVKHKILNSISSTIKTFNYLGKSLLILAKISSSSWFSGLLLLLLLLIDYLLWNTIYYCDSLLIDANLHCCDAGISIELCSNSISTFSANFGEFYFSACSIKVFFLFFP